MKFDNVWVLIILSIYKIRAKSINNVWSICWYRRIVLWSLACYTNRWGYETPKINLQMLLFYNEATHSLIVVEQAKGFHDFFLGISLSHLGCHHLQKLFKVDCPTPILINISYHFFDFLLPKSNSWFWSQENLLGNINILNDQIK